MEPKIFNPEKLDTLNNPVRLQRIPPSYILEKAQLKKNDVMIDFGAGTALFSKAFADIFPDTKIYACDISPVMIQWISDNITKTYTSIIPLQTQGNSVPLSDETADFLFMINVYHELEEPVSILKECFRLLKPKAKIAIADWKKEDTELGPAFNIRVNVQSVIDNLKIAGFTHIEDDSKLNTHYVVIAKKA